MWMLLIFYMFYKGKDIEKSNFIGGKKATIDKERCIECGKCKTVCKFDAIENFKIDPFLCEGCGTCTLICPQNAIKLEEEKTAETFITELDKGLISRAEMEVGSDGSGKLVTDLRKKAKIFNKDDKLTIIDGSPGIGCAVIASITGSDAILIVTEPTASGLEDLKRVIALCGHFGILPMVCVNKYDINKEMTVDIENFINEKGIKLVGKIPYDNTVMKSINDLKPITYYKESIANKAIEHMWKNIKQII
ncbi:iron-sulfur binding protein [Clostridium sporogenes]|nr:iron-sulfur binding protein [Clostridium sporogenes]